jgi:hypothetical protein
VEALRSLFPPHRAAVAALAASAALHGAAIVGYRGHEEVAMSLDMPAYAARLEPAAAFVESPAPRRPPAPRTRPKREAQPGETIAILPAALEEPDPVAIPELEPPPVLDEPPAARELVALAQPAVPVAALEPPRFSPDALPANVDISYALTSVFADGVAEYSWRREGERYEITGEAQASGFFTLFLEGRILQESRGRVTADGLKPDKFLERRPGTPEEGLTFDWEARTVAFNRGKDSRTAPLTDDTVDWLSMIFQLAHMPPQGDEMQMRVFTQRRMYQFRLQVLGREELELPFGRATTLHLLHEGEKSDERVDVWLGVDQHYLPVKMRYPVARNRLMVEQTATSIRSY